MMIEELKWDSEFFGKKIGKLTVINEIDFDPDSFIEQAIREKFELIYVFKVASELALGLINKAKLEIMDIHLLMSKKFIKEKYLEFPYNFRTELTDNELSGCYSIAADTSKVSRFYSEKSIGPVEASKLYKTWVDNTLNRTFSDGLFLEKQSNSVLGIHLIRTDCKNKTGYFTLTGVKYENKGLGVGSRLWMQSFAYWANESDIEIIMSPFSFRNLASFNFHLKMGFDRIEEVKYIYHWRK